MLEIKASNFGALPLVIQFVAMVGKLVLSYRMSAAAAAAQAAAEFEYFQALSEAEITQISFAMAEQYPEYPYWEWFTILRNIQKYEMLKKPEPAREEPEPKPKEEPQSFIWLIAVGVVAAVVLFARRRP